MQKSSLNHVGMLRHHPHTGAPIVPVGHRRDGRPIWPILGAAKDDPQKGKGKNDPEKDEPDGPDDDPDSDDPDDDPKRAGGKGALKADLARERDKRQGLEKTVADLQKAQEEQRDAFARALGLKPEETSDADKLTEQISKLTDRLDVSDRRTRVLEIATEYEVGKDDLHMLTAETDEELKKQAEWIKSKNTAAAEKRPPRSDPSQGPSGEPAKSGDAAAIQQSMERSLGRRPKQQDQ